jgi:hypothetical protein
MANYHRILPDGSIIYTVDGYQRILGDGSLVSLSSSGSPVNVSPSKGNLSLTGYSPSISQAQQVSPLKGHLSLTGYTPSIVQMSGQNVFPSTGHLSLNGKVPTISQPQTIQPSKGHLSLTGYTPIITSGVQLMAIFSINLPMITSLTPNDLVPFWSSKSQAVRQMSLSNFISKLISLIQSELDTPLKVSYLAPSSDFTINMVDFPTNLWVIIQPSGAINNMTLNLPDPSTLIADQKIFLKTTQNVTNVTVNGSGTSIQGGLTTMVANKTYRLRYNPTNLKWFKF